MTTIETFRWGSALGAGVGLFLSCAAVYVLIPLAGLAFYWLLGVLPAMRALDITSYFDIWHPFALYPTLVVPVAAVLAWAGLSR